MLADKATVEIDGNNDIRSQGTAGGDRNRIDQGAIKQPLAV